MKRHIFYFQYYKNGVMQGSCGHVRTLIHNGSCRMDFYIDKVPAMNGNVKIYFYRQDEKKLIGYPVMDGIIEQGALQIRYECKYGDVAEGKALSDMDGIMIFNGLNLMEAVIMSMKNEAVSVEDFVEASEEYAAKIEKDSVSEEEESEQELLAEEEESEQELLTTEEIKEADFLKDVSENSVYEYDEECLKKKMVETEGTAATCLEAETLTLHRRWQDKIFHAFPKVKVVIDGEDRMGIKLRPHDMVWLPGGYWRMASNQFLLNGYYRYRYILFFQGRDGKYYLGTPGAFGINTAMNAKKFGFTDFFAASECNQEENRFLGQEEKGFGFWVKEIN